MVCKLFNFLREIVFLKLLNGRMCYGRLNLHVLKYLTHLDKEIFHSVRSFNYHLLYYLEGLAEVPLAKV